MERSLAGSLAARLEVDRAVAGSATPVPGGVLLRCPRFPQSWDLNQLVLEPGAGAAAVAAAVELAERELRDAAHRRVTVCAPAGGFEVPDGWACDELLVMLGGTGDCPWPDGVEEVEAAELRDAHRAMWVTEGHAEHADQLTDMQLAFGSWEGARAVAVRGDAPGGFVAWGQVANGCIDDVWVRPERRGEGIGRAVTLAAEAAGGWSLWTDAADPRPQGLYRSLGFGVAGRVFQLTRS